MTVQTASDRMSEASFPAGYHPLEGAYDDVGVLSSIAAGRSQLVIAEALIVVFLTSGYALGRWARRSRCSTPRTRRSPC